MKNKLLLTIILGMFLISFIGASQVSLGTYAKGETIELVQICGTCTYNNITSIIYPNSSHSIVDDGMTQRGMEYTYTFSNTGLVGTYLVNGVGDLDGTNTAWAYEFKITEGGKDVPTDNLLIFIMLFTVAVFTLLTISFYKILKDLAQVNVNFFTVAFGLGSYGANLLYYYFLTNYAPFSFLLDLSFRGISALGITHLFTPLVGLIFSWIK